MQWMSTIVQTGIERGWDHVKQQYTNKLKFNIYYFSTNQNNF